MGPIKILKDDKGAARGILETHAWGGVGISRAKGGAGKKKKKKLRS